MQKVPARLLAKICKMPRLLGIVETRKIQGVPEVIIDLAPKPGI